MEQLWPTPGHCAALALQPFVNLYRFRLGSAWTIAFNAITADLPQRDQDDDSYDAEWFFQ